MFRTNSVYLVSSFLQLCEHMSCRACIRKAYAVAIRKMKSVWSQSQWSKLLLWDSCYLRALVVWLLCLMIAMMSYLCHRMTTMVQSTRRVVDLSRKQMPDDSNQSIMPNQTFYAESTSDCYRSWKHVTNDDVTINYTAHFKSGRKAALQISSAMQRWIRKTSGSYLPGDVILSALDAKFCLRILCGLEILCWARCAQNFQSWCKGVRNMLLHVFPRHTPIFLSQVLMEFFVV